MAQQISRTVTRSEHDKARALLRANGRYSLRWMPERVAQVFRALLDAPADDLTEKAHFLAGHHSLAAPGTGTMGAQWTAYARRGAK